MAMAAAKNKEAPNRANFLDVFVVIISMFSLLLFRKKGRKGLLKM